MKTKRQQAVKTYCTDDLMRNVWFHLVRDMRSAIGDGQFLMRQEKALRSSIAEYRETPFPGKFKTDPYMFKGIYQMENLFKRYTFSDDPLQSDDRSALTDAKFIALQERLARPPRRTLRSFQVLQKARTLVKQILGKFDPEEHKTSCRFGKRACNGVPARNAYIDSKLETITGSDEHIRWFINDYLPTDSILQGVISSVPWAPWDQVSRYQVCECLEMTNVPKSWKIDRGICPNTVIGSFHSYGIGKMIQDRLESIGLDIRSLQQAHRRKAQRFSKTRTHVTADLSNASNSYIYQLLAQLLPRDWLRAICFGRVPYVMVNGAKIHCQSYMMMGIGYTFTLQTLLFYALIKAVQQLLGRENGTVSVYGDDLIYPREIHDHVKTILNDLGFDLNEDKTYVETHFRESCGGDYYHGTDVRPFQPEGQHSLLTRKPYVLLLYKTINGLLARWHECEVGQTLHFLFREVLRVDSDIKVVPASFPDYAGAKLELNSLHLPLYGIRTPIWAKPIWSKNVFEWRFMAYKYESFDRAVVREYAYYWEALRSGGNVDLEQEDPNSDFLDKIVRANYSGLPGLKLRRCELQDFAKKVEDVTPQNIIRFKEAAHQPKNYRSKLNGKRLKKLVALVARKGGQRILQSISPAEPRNPMIHVKSSEHLTRSGWTTA